MATKQLKLTRGQIVEFVGEDLNKIRVIENLIATALVQNEVLSGIRTMRWADGRMEQYPEAPTASTGATVTFPTPFYITPNITSVGTLTVSAKSKTAFTWTSSTGVDNMWRAIGRWKE